MGRPRGDQQLVIVEVADGGQALHREIGAAARRARGTRLPRIHADRARRRRKPRRVYRKVAYGPLLDVFFIDMRSYRGPNTDNAQKEPGPETVFLGREQLDWLKRELMASRATWKVIAADMPLGLIVYDDAPKKKGSEAIAQGDGPPLGRELEFADLLSFIKHAGIRNTVWLTADVHYTAAHYYDPNKAAVPGLRAVLGVRLRAAARRHVRAERARQYVRPAAALHQGAVQRRRGRTCRRASTCSSSATSRSTARAR